GFAAVVDSDNQEDSGRRQWSKYRLRLRRGH
ncbi:MAG: hypothetical protein QOI39_1692, partial [Mycobacterium sp.]|nr:hypothetical protein [Mycobacterium sp.]